MEGPESEGVAQHPKKVKKINPYNKLRTLFEEVRGTESEAMKALAAITAKIRSAKERKDRGRAASAAVKGKK